MMPLLILVFVICVILTRLCAEDVDAIALAHALVTAVVLVPALVIVVATVIVDLIALVIIQLPLHLINKYFLVDI